MTTELNQKVVAMAIFEFIEIWYNQEKHHSRGYRTSTLMKQLLNHQSLDA